MKRRITRSIRSWTANAFRYRPMSGSEKAAKEQVLRYRGSGSNVGSAPADQAQDNVLRYRGSRGVAEIDIKPQPPAKLPAPSPAPQALCVRRVIGHVRILLHPPYRPYQGAPAADRPRLFRNGWASLRFQRDARHCRRRRALGTLQGTVCISGTTSHVWDGTHWALLGLFRHGAQLTRLPAEPRAPTFRFSGNF